MKAISPEVPQLLIAWCFWRILGTTLMRSQRLVSAGHVGKGYAHPRDCIDGISLSKNCTKPKHLLHLHCLWCISIWVMERVVKLYALCVLPRLCRVLQCPYTLLHAWQRGNKQTNLAFLLQQQALHFIFQCTTISLYIWPLKEGKLDIAIKMEALPWDCPYFNRDGCTKVENILVWCMHLSSRFKKEKRKPIQLHGYFP